MTYVILCFWLFGFIFLWHIPILKKGQKGPFDHAGVSVIIPARNEEKNLVRLLESIDRQTVKPDEVIVVNDQSKDATAEIGQTYGHKVITASTPDEGWLGKPWSCWLGANAAFHDILLFLDADTFLEPQAISMLLSDFRANGGLLTVQPYHKIDRNYERLSAVFNIIAMAGLNAFTPLNRRIKPAGAFGPLIMCRKGHYFEVGGHKIAKNSVLESIPLGRAFMAAGLEVHCYGGKGAISYRMYPEGLRSLIEGFSKGFARGAHAISSSVLIMLICWIFGGISLTRHLIQSFVTGDFNEIMIWLILDVLYAAQIQWMLIRIGNFGVWTAVFFQIPLIFFVFIFFISVLKTFVIRQVRWKGRVVATKDFRGKSSCD
jgi:4,4'-diaponeurosporenoate glycosyltransferase